MGAKIRIEHNGAAWMQIFKSAEMQSVVDEAGQRIANEAGEHFKYSPATKNRATVAGFVTSNDPEGDGLEATDKVLTRATHA